MIDLNTVNLASYRSQLGVVLQETFLFDGTIRDNVMFSRPAHRSRDARSMPYCTRGRICRSPGRRQRCAARTRVKEDPFKDLDSGQSTEFHPRGADKTRRCRARRKMVSERASRRVEVPVLEGVGAAARNVRKGERVPDGAISEDTRHVRVIEMSASGDMSSLPLYFANSEPGPKLTTYCGKRCSAVLPFSRSERHSTIKLNEIRSSSSTT